MTMRRAIALLSMLTLLLSAGCGKQEGFRPIDPDATVFWDRQTAETAALLETIAAEFNAAHPGPPIRIEYTGGYSEIDRKVSASIRARSLPALSVGYPGMTLQYIRAGAALPLDPLIEDPDTGFSPEEWADFLPAALDTNRYPSHGGAMYSFPFAKSVLVLYYNRDLLRAAGFDAPPATWNDFLEQCRAVKARLGLPAYAMNVDCSTVNGFILSMGGRLLADGATCYDSPEALRVFEIYETVAREELGFRIARGFDDQAAVSQGEAAFSFRSSAGRVQMAEAMAARVDAWGIARIPQADPQRPATVLYGPNFILFDTTPEQRDSAWRFVKHFTSPEVQVRWALGSGYVPVRKSAIDDPRARAFREQSPQNRAAFECLDFAHAEPNVAGWQQVRDIVERHLADLMGRRLDARTAAQRIKQEADATLAAAR